MKERPFTLIVNYKTDKTNTSLLGIQTTSIQLVKLILKDKPGTSKALHMC